MPVPDLTTIAARSGGKFPAERVQKIIASGENLRGHGSADMPAWGDVFKRTTGLDGATPDQAIRNLTHYLWSLQRGRLLGPRRRNDSGLDYGCGTGSTS